MVAVQGVAGLVGGQAVQKHFNQGLFTPRLGRAKHQCPAVTNSLHTAIDQYAVLRHVQGGLQAGCVQ